ncbi:protein BCCIP homolog [Ischnura elegans]|uniref:protein BCCIP homolog n=1 Tax=Ischnura elegans TaxID=197161 RepID=UPI001ED86900|nr:protein BCCIP homolog [Ischnura elegans]XP_046383879.1 protein BCCIP homolog [Ischnura elegans]
MAAPVKKRMVGGDDSDNIEDNDGSDSSDSSIEEDDFGAGEQEEIQVDFEGRNPIDSDFHGIKQLLQQLFLKAHVNLSELTELIISQNYVGSVVKQSEVDEDSDCEDEDMDSNDVFGITSVINLTDKKDLECVRQLRSLLLELCEEHGSNETKELVRSLVQASGQQHHVGLLVTERFINIPVQIAVPLLESLSKEIKRAQEKGMPFEFAYFILICKLYKMDMKASKKGRKMKGGKGKKETTEDLSVIWSNPEEEVIDEEADYRFEFCVKDEAGSGLGGKWGEGDAEMIPYRRVLILRADRFEHAIAKVKAFVTEEVSSKK